MMTKSHPVNCKLIKIVYLSCCNPANYCY